MLRLDDGQPIAKGRSLTRGRIEPLGHTLRFAGVPLTVQALEVVPDESGAIHVGDRPYRGALQIVRDARGRLSLRNRLPVDDYLRGVVGAEMPADFPAEALRAQAIIARTYALHGPEPLPGEVEPPLTDSVMSQVYRGVAGEDPRIQRAVADTSGLVLTAGGELFTGYFHSTCGGATADVFRVFGRTPSPPLRGVVCGYCDAARYSRWSETISRVDVERAASMLGSPGKLAALEVSDRDGAGRAMRLKITVAGRAQRHTKEVPAADFRLALGPERLRSSFITGIADLGDGLRFEGRGFGHGVGLCQLGARQMAVRGFGAKAILLHYFPGAEMRKLYG